MTDLRSRLLDIATLPKEYGEPFLYDAQAETVREGADRVEALEKAVARIGQIAECPKVGSPMIILAEALDDLRRIAQLTKDPAP